MKARDAAKEITERLRRLGHPPTTSDTDDSLLTPAQPRRGGRPRKSVKMAQLNLRVPEEIKDRVRLLAARERIEMSQVVVEAIILYEAKYGAVPKLKPTVDRAKE